MTPRHLADYLEASAARCPERAALVDSTGCKVTFSELNQQADSLAGFLATRGVTRGDRVGVVLPKGIPAVVALFGIMKAGAAYVPVDHSAPTERIQRILTDCQVRALIADGPFLDGVSDLESDAQPLAAVIAVGAVEDSAETRHHVIPFARALETIGLPGTEARNGADLAYILYTSGSTGIPKGVMITHDNALSFVEWCSTVFEPTENDRFSSHAPFHFDLSVLDIYLSIKHGATLYLISDGLGKNPKELARFIAAHQLTVWYSTPSILALLLQFAGARLDDLSSLRLVLFAGEVFPVKHLRQLQRRLPSPIYYNLYGPTETNVCTFARIPRSIPADREAPFPIGFPCRHCDARVLNGDGQDVAPGDEGLLYISGPSVFVGYWNRPVENGAAFLDRDSVRWYNTGDLVRWSANDGFTYVGRKDRMVKRRGYRIELGEIERALYLHPRLREVAVVSVPDDDAGQKIVAFLSCHQGETSSIVELKTFCGTKLPSYMNPDRFVFYNRLPRTSTDKVDYQVLQRQLIASETHSDSA